MTGSWSLGVLIGGPIAALLLLVCLVLGGLALRWWARNREHADASIALGVSIVCAVGLVAVVGVSAWAFYPYEAEYHRWEPKSGVVEDVGRRLLPAGEGMQEKIVVRFEGDGQEYGIEDTRAALLERGDELTITCKRVWQYAGEDGFDCRWVEASSQARGDDQ
jgi:hypothetical protein